MVSDVPELTRVTLSWTLFTLVSLKTFLRVDKIAFTIYDLVRPSLFSDDPIFMPFQFGELFFSFLVIRFKKEKKMVHQMSENSTEIEWQFFLGKSLKNESEESP